MTLIKITCDCGTEYSFGVDSEEADEEPEMTSIDADKQKEADPVLKPALDIEVVPSGENPDDPFWAPDASEENETRIHEVDPVEFRSTKARRIGFARPR